MSFKVKEGRTSLSQGSALVIVSAAFDSLPVFFFLNVTTGAFSCNKNIFQKYDLNGRLTFVI